MTPAGDDDSENDQDDMDEKGGDSDAGGGSEGAESEAGGEDSDFQGGMMAPPGVEPTHFDDFDDKDHEYDSESGASKATSGIEELDSDWESQESEDDMVATLAAPASSDPGSKVKAFHMSPEWKELEAMGLTNVPNVLGAGVNRHPAKNFWTMRYPGSPIKSVSWGGMTGRSPRQSLVKVLKHLCQLHMNAVKGTNAAVWKSQMERLQELN